MARLVAWRRHRLAREVLMLYGLDLPPEVVIGRGLVLQHRGMGTVVQPQTVLGDRVHLYHQVTIGRADSHRRLAATTMERVEIGDDVILFPGAKVLGGPGVTRVGCGTVVAANAVLTTSTGEWEIWAGVPARRVGTRSRVDAIQG